MSDPTKPAINPVTPPEAFYPFDHVVNGVYISGWRATQYQQALLAKNIRHVLKLYQDDPHFSRASFTMLDNALPDGEAIPPAKLRRGVAFIRAQVTAARPVLVMCGAGISRSATFVLAYMLTDDYDLRDAYHLLKRAHPAAAPHPALWQSLIDEYAVPYSLTDVLTWSADYGSSSA